MSTAPRVLAIAEHRVAPEGRDAFLAAVAMRRLAAAAAGAHVWIFEHLDEPGRFVEFTEAANAANVAVVHGGKLPAPLWREVQGG